MLLFIDHVSGKKPIIPAMDTVAGGSMRLIEGARSLIHTAFVAAVKRAIASGDLRSNTDPYDSPRPHRRFPHHRYTRLGAQRPPPHRHPHRRFTLNAQAPFYPTS
jgi:hypothetical protein